MKEVSTVKLEESKNFVAIKDNQAGALMSIIEKIATNKDLDDNALVRIEKLFDLHKELVDRQAEKDYGAAMARAQGAIRPVFRNKFNSHTKAMYTDIVGLHLKAKPIWTSEGFAVTSMSYDAKTQGYIGIRCIVRHSVGHKETYENIWPLDISGSAGKINKTPIQALGSTISYARRYLELMIFDVSTTDDNDGEPIANSISDEKAAWIKKELQALNVNVKAFCGYIKCKNVDSMEDSQLITAKQFIQARRIEREAK